MIASDRRCRVLLVLLASAAVLTGCWQKDPPAVDPNLPPTATEYRKEVIELTKTLLDDATNIRDAGITDPFLGPAAGTPRYMICVRFNPRNANHEYTGIVERVGYFYAG